MVKWAQYIRGAPPPKKKKTKNKKKHFFGEIFPKCGWVGWLIPKQGTNP